MTPKLVPLEPFGVRVELAPGKQLGDLDIPLLESWIDEHRVVQLRGLEPVAPHVLASASRRLGPLQPWSFGAVDELRQIARTENYLYTEHAVPLHGDGAFADAVPHGLVFHCVSSAPAGAGGETVFVDTIRVLARATPQQRKAWQAARFRYTTEKKAHYGGSFVSKVVRIHPTLGVDVMRYAEPVSDLNPVSVEPLDVAAGEGERIMSDLGAALAVPEVSLALPWREGDFVIADNHALLNAKAYARQRSCCARAGRSVSRARSSPSGRSSSPPSSPRGVRPCTGSGSSRSAPSPRGTNDGSRGSIARWKDVTKPAGAPPFAHKASTCRGASSSAHGWRSSPRRRTSSRGAGHEGRRCGEEPPFLLTKGSRTRQAAPPMMRAVATPDLHALASRVRAASRGPPRCLRDHVAAVEARERAGAGVHREEARNDAAVRLCVHFAPRRQAASSSDGRRAAVTNSDRSGRASASNDGVIHVFDLATGAHPAGKLLISGGHRGFQVSDLKLRVWNLGTRKCERTITHAKMPGAFTPLSLALDPRTDTIARLERLERTRSRACVENPAYGGVSSAAKTSSASFGGEQPRVPCGIVLWPAAIALAHEIASRQVAGMRVLELGAGTGLPGIVAASLGAHVVQTDKQELALFVCKKNAERNGVTTIQHRAADWTAWEDREAYDLIIGADVLYADTMHPHLRAIFERNLAPGGTILLSDPFRKESLALLEAMETSGWKVTMNKWTVGITPPERPVGVFELTLPA